MAKIRVYELAKKLNMTNRVFLTKLKAMNIEVKSHMSSLEDETVARIKENIFGEKNPNADTRVRTSVIRRRKKSKKNRGGEGSPGLKEYPPRPHADASSDMTNNSNIEDADISGTPGNTISGQEDRLSGKTEPSGKIPLSDNIDSTEPEDFSSSGELPSSADKENPDKENLDKENPDKDNLNDHKMPPPQTDSKEQISAGKPRDRGRSKKYHAKIIKPATVVAATDDSRQSTTDIPEIGSEPVEQNIENQDASLESKDSLNPDSKNQSGAFDPEISESQNEESNPQSFRNPDEKDNETLSASNISTPVTDLDKAAKELNIKEADMPQKLESSHHADAKAKTSPVHGETGVPVPHNSGDSHQADSSQKQGEEQEGQESSSPGDKKRKRKRKQKKSEPAKIIKLALPVAKKPFKKDKSDDDASDKDASGRDTSNRDASNRDTSNRDASNRDASNRDANSHGGGDVTAVSRKIHKSSPPAADRGNVRKVPDSDGGSVLPVQGGEKDDLKSRRKKGKLKSKKKVEDTEVNDDLGVKGAFKKRKSVVEGKDLYDREFGGKKGRRKDAKNRRAKAQKTQITVPKAIKRRIKIDETIELSELAKRMSIKANEMIVKLMGLGVMVTVNQTIDFDTAALVAAEFDYEVEKAAAVEDVLMHVHDEDDPEKLIPRSPVVTIMGHVDHGKTSLLDVIRKSKIATGEAGGITQHIGAYSVQTPNGGMVTFLDTPGHEAFTSMRSRGAQVTDIVVLVVAADDGVMPQTVEAINHSKAAGVPVVVAVNKMDKPDADPDKVMRELSDYGLLSEDWGGDVIFSKVSAKSEMGIDHLLEMIMLQAEVLELKANPDRQASGHVVEARLDPGRGPVATVLIQHGTLKTGEPVVCGLHSGKIRAMIGDMGQPLDSAGPSTPVEIVGLSGVPDAGDEFVALASEKDAKQISENRMQKERAKELAKKSRANLEKLFANMGTNEVKELKLLIKADVHGSLEALNDSLMKLAQEEVDIKIVHSGIGAINESDVSLAAVSDAIILGFNVRPTPKVRDMAREENVDMRFYDIIYNVINDIKAALTGLMPSTFHEIIIGRAEVRDTFVIPGKGTIAGCFIQEGKVARGEKIRLLREGVIKCDTSLSSLRRFKDDAKEVSQGYECGIGLDKYNDIKVGDIIECYEVEERKASIDSLKS
ncbi:MAG: translation initiation factor IF-2 [Desulfamplus sp.]|nr:translation initiation factor IF-2 [Desulfamplus sp.]